MRIKLLRKLTWAIDNLDLPRHHIGDIVSLPVTEAQFLIDEGWAVRADRQPLRSIDQQSSPAQD